MALINNARLLGVLVKNIAPHVAIPMIKYALFHFPGISC